MEEDQFKKDIEELFGEDVLREIYGVTPYARNAEPCLHGQIFAELSKESR